MAKKEISAKDVATVKKGLKAYLDLESKKAALKDEERAIAEGLYGVIGSAKLTLASSGLEVAAIRKRTSPAGETPETFMFYMKRYGRTKPAHEFDL